MSEPLYETIEQLSTPRYATRYKATPIPTARWDEEPLYCLKINDQWVSHLLGLLVALDQNDTWLGTSEEIFDARQQVNQIMAALMEQCNPMDNCCPEPNRTRVTSDGMYEISYDGGATWQDGSDSDPRYTAPQLPPIAGDDSEANKCNAANNVLLQFQDGIETWEGYFDTLGTALEFVVAVATAIAAFIFAPAAVPIIVTIIFSLFKAIWDGGKEAYVAAFTSTVWDDLLCILYCHCQNDGTYLESDVDAILSDISTHFSSIARDAFTALMHGVRAPGLNQMAKSGSGGSGDCATCGCEEGPCENKFIPYKDFANPTDTSKITGTDFIRGDGWLQATSVVSSLTGGFQTVGITTNNSMKCCYIDHIEVNGAPGSTNAAWRVCGEAIPAYGDAFGHGGLNVPCDVSVNTVLFYNAGDAFTIKIFFSETPCE